MQSTLQVTLFGPLGETPALQLPEQEGPSVAIPEAVLRRLVSDLYTARSLLNPEQLDEARQELGAACWSAGPTSMKACCWMWKCMADERLRVVAAAWAAPARTSLNRVPSCG